MTKRNSRRCLSALGSLLLSIYVVMSLRPDWLPWWVKIPLDPQADARNLAGLESQPEARLWIRDNGREGPLASARFEGKVDALAFVDALYEAGADKVVVDMINDDKLEMAEGGPYADALIVRLPNDPRKRKQLLAIANSECNKAGKAVADVWRETVYFTWSSD